MTDTAILDIPIVEIEKRLFKARDFDFITITERGKNWKQELALNELTMGKYKYILYGGAAGGAKSWTGSAWLVFMSICYPGTKWFIGRQELKSITESTWITMQKVLKAYGVKDAKYNAQKNYVLFSNGSRIDFLKLAFMPRDPLYERFGSLEYTGGWIEEGGETVFAAFDVLKTRIGRHLNDKYGIKPVLFITCNPKKNWLYTEFYAPSKKGELKPDRTFIQAFVQDNPARESDYLAQLESIEDKSTKERLLLGNWDYDDDPAALVEFDAILDLFTNDFVQPTGLTYISADLAMKGRDRFVAGAWDGLVGTIDLDQAKSTGKSIEVDLKGLMIRKAVPRSRTVVDSDGLGSYLESYLNGIKEFHGGAKATKDKEYDNLKSECAYKLAGLINKRKIRIMGATQEQKTRLSEELGVLKAKDVDADEKRKRIISKDQMKQLINRSPDYLDYMLMRMYFEVKKSGQIIDQPQMPGSTGNSELDAIKASYL